MKEIVKILLRIILLLVVLFLVTRIFKRADERSILSPAKSAYSKGNAPDSTRKEVIGQLNKFQDGYSRRDTSQVDAFMQSLYSRENILILGTSPGEICKDYDKASGLVRSDWESWGDCRFMVDSANISSDGNTAWFSTRGYVKFDLSGLLVIPLRLTGIMVKEDQVWKFRQQQFQFDIDFSFTLLAILVLTVWILVSLVTLAVVSVRVIKGRTSRAP
jgi:SnoaL-like domain